MSSEFFSKKLTETPLNRETLLYLIVGLILATILTFSPINLIIGVPLSIPLIYLAIRYALRHPWTLWLYMAAFLPFLSTMKIGPATALDGLLALIAGLWFVQGIRKDTPRVHMSVPAILFSLYASGLLFSFFNAVDLVEAFSEVLKWIELWLVLLLAREMIPSKHMPWLIVALLLGGLVQGIIGLTQFWMRIGPDWFLILGQFMRASGTFGQPNPYAGYLGLCLPVAVSLFSWTIFRKERNNLLALCTFIVAIVIGLGLFASWSRGAWLGAAAALSIVLWIYDRRSSIFVGGTMLAVVLTLLLLARAGIYIVPQPVLDRFSDVPALIQKSSKGIDQILNEQLTSENFAAMERAAHWLAAIKMWQESPLLGVGPGNYAEAYPQTVHKHNRLRRWKDPLGHAHNVYLNVLAEGGAFGLLLYLGVWGSVLAWVVSKIRSPVGYYRALSVGIIGIMIHLHVHNIFDNLFVQGIYLHIGLWLTTLLYEPKTVVAEFSQSTFSQTNWRESFCYFLGYGRSLIANLKKWIGL